MIVRKSTKVIYTIELTEAQHGHLELILQTFKKEGRDLIAIQAAEGETVADAVSETCDNLLESL